MYRVIKTIGGRRYMYDQRTWRENGKVKTQSIYVGPAEGDESRGILSRRPKCKEENIEADLEHALVMVARLTGRTIEDQLAEMEAEYSGRNGDTPTISVASTFAEETTTAIDEQGSAPSEDGAATSASSDVGGGGAES